MALLAAYSFDEAGNTVIDYSGNSNDFSIAGTGLTRSANGQTNGGLLNSGSVEAFPPNIGQSNNRTVMAHIKGTYSAAGWPIQWFVSSIPSGAWGILILSGQIHIQARNASTFVRASTNIPADINTVWHHVAGTYDGSNVRLYLDGVLQGSPVPLTGPLRTDGVLQLFGYLESDNIDNLRIFDSAEDSNIVSWMNTPVGPVGGASMADSIADKARKNMLINRSLTEPRRETNSDLMSLVLADGAQTLLTKTSASVGTHLVRYMLTLK